MKNIFANAYAEIHDARRILPDTFVIQWIGFWTHKEPRVFETLQSILDIITEHKPKILLSDYFRFEIYTDEMLEHLLHTWYPRFVENGLVMEIYIIPHDIVSETNLEDKFDQLERHGSPLITPKAESHDHAYSIIREYTKLYN